MVGVLSLLLFMMAGLAVDLGNAWARGRTVQKQVDVSALSVGHRLPMRAAAGHTEAAIAEDVARQLVRNGVLGQAVAADATSTEDARVTELKADLVDADTTNGDLQFFATAAAAKAGTPECATGCPVMKVVAPEADVDFAFGGAVGADKVAVQREAIVAVQSAVPPRQKLIPFWLPSGCGYGPTHADTTNGNSKGAPAAAGAWTLPRTEAASSVMVPAAAPTPTPVGDHVLGGTAKSVVAGSTATLNGYSVTGVGNQFKKVSLRAFRPDGRSYVDFSAQTTGDGALPSMQVGPNDITGTAGEWYVFALAVKQNGDVAYSKNNLTITVTGTPPTPTPTPTPTPSPTPTTASPSPTDTTSPSPTTTASPTVTATPSPTVTGVDSGCVGQDRGNFGQLESPRADESNLQKAFARNIALGIDHTLVPYVFPPSVGEKKECGSGASLLPGAKLNTQAGTAGNGTNCIKGDTGNDGPKTYDGLVAGVDGLPGRLAAANGTTTCSGRSNVTVGSAVINNDSLACFLRPGVTLADIAADDGVNPTMIDPRIMKSPRFVYLPVVYASDRAQKNHQPIRSFVPGFITEETTTKSVSAVTSAVNGLDINGNSVKVLHVFTFNQGALEPPESSDTVTYDPNSDASIVRLVG